MPSGVYIRKSFTKEHRRKISLAKQGKSRSEETKKKISLAKQGKSGPNKGKKFSKETREKMRIARIEYLKTKPNGMFISKSAKLFLDALENVWGNKIEREFELGGRFFDGKVGNLLIEVDSKYWHNRPDRICVDAEKELIAKNNGFELRRFNVNDESDISSVLQRIIGE